MLFTTLQVATWMLLLVVVAVCAASWIRACRMHGPLRHLGRKQLRRERAKHQRDQARRGPMVEG